MFLKELFGCFACISTQTPEIAKEKFNPLNSPSTMWKMFTTIITVFRVHGLFQRLSFDFQSFLCFTWIDFFLDIILPPSNIHYNISTIKVIHN